MKELFGHSQDAGSAKLLVMVLLFAAAVVGFFCWEYYREWRIRRFYERKEWKERYKKR